MGLAEEAHNVRVLGSGDQTVVLAHGFGTDQSLWKHLVPHLVEEYKVVLYDIMGAGTTNPDYFDFERYSTLEGFACDVIAILDEIGVKSCVYVGHSVSAMIGVIASIKRPDLFTKLVTVSASPRYLNSPDYYGGFEEEDLHQLFEAMKSNYKAWSDGFAPLLVGGDMESVAVQEFSRILFNMRPDIALSIAQTIFYSDMRPFLGRLTVPCHIIQSMKDLAVPVVVSEYLHQNFGGESIVEVMSTDGHLPQLSSPDVVVPILLRHIRRQLMGDILEGTRGAILRRYAVTLSNMECRCGHWKMCGIPCAHAIQICRTENLPASRYMKWYYEIYHLEETYSWKFYPI